MSSNSKKDASIGGAAAAGVGAEWTRGLNEAVEAANEALKANASHSANRNLSSAQGFFAEQWHASTFNIDAYKQGAWDLLATVPESTKRGSPDIQIHNGETLLQDIQSKYWKTPGDTAKQMWNPEYTGGGKVVPADQAEAAREISSLQAMSDHRAQVREAAAHSAENISDKISEGDVSSKALGREESAKLTERTRKGEDVLSTADVLSGKEIAMNAAQGGAIAAGIGFAIGAAPKLLEALKAYREGSGLDDEEFRELLTQAGKDGATSGAWAGLQGATSVALVQLTSTGQLGELLGQAGPGPVGAMAVVAVGALRDGFALHRGEIDAAEFARRTTNNAVVASGGVAGAVIGQALIPIPVLGALIGSTVGSLVASVGVRAAEWTAERVAPFLDEALNRIGESLFAWDLIEQSRKLNLQTNAAIDAQLQRLEQAGQRRLAAWKSLQVEPIDVEAHLSMTKAQEHALASLEAAFFDMVETDA